MLLDKVQSSTAELFCFSAARNHFTVLMLSQTLPLSSLQKRTVLSNDSTIYGPLKKQNEIFYPAS